MSSPSSPAAAAPDRPGLFKRLYLWVLSWAETRYGTPALFVLSFAESSFFPVPPDVLQIALSVGRPKRSFYYAAVSAVGSVLGGVLGWYIGFALWESMSTFFFEYVPGVTAENFDKVQARYDEHAFLAIFGAAFTPIPFKVFTIASGVFEVALPTLIIASALGRSLRFMIVATAIFFFGPPVKDLLDRYFGIVTFVLLVLLVAGFASIKFLLH
jgi:membrane protein YqaA with SNARE-associated domain